jgi:hypothetical protein
MSNIYRSLKIIMFYILIAALSVILLCAASQGAGMNSGALNAFVDAGAVVNTVSDTVDATGKTVLNGTTLPLETPPFSLEKIVIGTPLWQALTKINGGKEIKFLQTIGTRVEVLDRSEDFLNTATDTELVALSFTRLDDNNAKRHIIVIDFARDLKVRIGKMIMHNMIRVNQNVFLMDVTEKAEENSLYLGHISLDFDSRELDLRGRGFMRDIFRNWEKTIGENYVGYTVVAQAQDKKAHHFMQSLGAQKPLVRIRHRARLEAGENIENLWADYSCVVAPFSTSGVTECSVLASA